MTMACFYGPTFGISSQKAMTKVVTKQTRVQPSFFGHFGVLSFCHPYARVCGGLLKEKKPLLKHDEMTEVEKHDENPIGTKG